jgi:hypothetical protein
LLEFEGWDYTMVMPRHAKECRHVARAGTVVLGRPCRDPLMYFGTDHVQMSRSVDARPLGYDIRIEQPLDHMGNQWRDR